MVDKTEQRIGEDKALLEEALRQKEFAELIYKVVPSAIFIAGQGLSLKYHRKYGIF